MPPQLYRYDRFVSATVSAGLAKGVTLSQGLEEMDRIANEVLSDDFKTTLSGTSKDFVESSSSLMFAVGIHLLGTCRAVREFPRPVDHHVDRPLGVDRGHGRLVVFRADHEHFQPNRYHHVGRIGFKERNLDRGIRQPAETGRLVHA